MMCRSAIPVERPLHTTSAQSFKLIEDELAHAIGRVEAGASAEEIAGRLQAAHTLAVLGGAYAKRQEREAVGS